MNRMPGFVISIAASTTRDIKCGMKWRPGTVVMRDNWATQHYACGDDYPSFRGVKRVTFSTPRYTSLGLN
ncbi:TauD/TfdA family dioxygenase [Candidatus Puniceispirillum sp.]|nr:TauD/TfdA family dioxygenase [Candidatus Puniceispirillum sp.]